MTAGAVFRIHYMNTLADSIMTRHYRAMISRSQPWKSWRQTIPCSAATPSMRHWIRQRNLSRKSKRIIQAPFMTISKGRMRSNCFPLPCKIRIQTPSTPVLRTVQDGAQYRDPRRSVSHGVFIFFQHIIDRLSGDAQQFRGVFFIAVCQQQGFFQQFAIGVIDLAPLFAKQLLGGLCF